MQLIELQTITFYRDKKKSKTVVFFAFLTTVISKIVVSRSFYRYFSSRLDIAVASAVPVSS